MSGERSYGFGWGGGDDNSLMTNNSVQAPDFNRQDENSLQIRADYELSAIPGLKIMARRTIGESSVILG
ncbi:OprD family outer membrane porin [Desulfosediminicola flagellatus]|uniref:OprD family outer membrane porin n=1 Tax=Desulfosediminicola flagellatus TaxID=2569541 RepID=UPI0010AD0DEF|nr:OprD family outer membrane porin [Desulfosediminicola flagellatus]